MVTMRDLSWLKSNWLHLTSLSTDLPGSARKSRAMPGITIPPCPETRIRTGNPTKRRGNSSAKDKKTGVQTMKSQSGHLSILSVSPAVRQSPRFYIIPPSGIAGAAGAGSGISTIPHSVVRNIPATEAAFSRATRLTLVGSITPASNILTYSSVRAL